MYVSKCHVELNYECETDEALVVRDPSKRNYLVFSDYGSGMRDLPFKKAVVSDGDGVIEEPGSPSMAWQFVDEISDLPNMRQYRDYIFRDFVMIERGNQAELHATDLQTILKNNGFRFEQYDKACYNVARNVELVSGYKSGVEQIMDMGYELFYLSASPEGAFYHAQDRLMVDMNHVKASEFVFDDDGYFKSIKLNISDFRAKNRDDILRSSCMSDFGFNIMIDDNPKTGSKIAKQGWNHVCFWVNGDQPMIENVSVMAKDIREDYRRLPARLKMLDRAMMVMLLKDERDYSNLVKMANEVLEYGRCCMDGGKTYMKYKDLFINKLENYISGMRPIFPARRSGLELMLEELKLERNEIKSKERIRKMMTIFESMSPECKMSPLLG
jgi:hypothetical protein